MKTFINLDQAIKFRKIEELLDLPVIIRVKDFTAYAVEVFDQQLQRAMNTQQPVVPVIIDSYGGQAYSVRAMVSLMEDCSKPVATIALGKAMSCGAILLGNGTKGFRFADSNATIMIHDLSSGKSGKIEELKASVNESDRLNNTIYHKLAKKCGHKDKGYFLKKMSENKQADLFLTALQAKRHGLVDHIGIPEMNVNIDVNMEFKI